MASNGGAYPDASGKAEMWFVEYQLQHPKAEKRKVGLEQRDKSHIWHIESLKISRK